MSRAAVEAHAGLVALAGAAVVVTLAYANSFGTALVFDSRALIAENPVVREPSLANLGFILTHDYWQPMSTDGLYRPLPVLSYVLNYAVNGARPFGYHAVNLVLHLGCMGLVYALVWHLVGRAWPAVVAAAVFGLHPVATEAVTNVVGRADLLVALGVLAGVLCHARATTDDARRAAWSAGVAASAALAVFSKESGLVLLPLLVAYDLLYRRQAFHGGRAFPRLLAGYAGPVAVLVAYGAARAYVARIGFPPEDISPVDNPIVEVGFWTGRLTAIKVLGRELWLLVFPLWPSADYSYAQVPVVSWPPRTWGDWEPVLALATFGVLAWWTFRLRSTSGLLFLVLWFALTLLPTANLVRIVGSIMADRFLYLPLVGFAGATALVAERLARRGDTRVVTAVVALVLVACAGRTWARNRDWTNETTLWERTLRTAPASAKARKGYAAALFAEDPRRTSIDRVIAEGQQAVAIRPDYVAALVDLGGYYIAKGDLLPEGSGGAWYDRAIDVLERARALDERSARRFREKALAHGADRTGVYGNRVLYTNLPLAYARAGRLEQALAAYEEARRLEPDKLSNYVDISAALARLGRWEEAAVALFQAVTVAPDDNDAAVRLAGIYQHFYADGHAVVADRPDHVTINLDHPVVQRHRCQAYRGLVEVYTHARDPNAAARAAKLATDSCRDGDG